MIACYLLREWFSNLAHKNHLWSVTNIQILRVHPVLVDWSLYSQDENVIWLLCWTDNISEHMELQKFCLVLFTWWTFTDITELWKYSGQVRQPFGAREGTEKWEMRCQSPQWYPQNIHGADCHGINTPYCHYRIVYLSPSVDELPEDND